MASAPFPRQLLNQPFNGPSARFSLPQRSISSLQGGAQEIERRQSFKKNLLSLSARNL
jgi:hypothetical protein